jgi:hypothetical protein
VFHRQRIALFPVPAPLDSEHTEHSTSVLIPKYNSDFTVVLHLDSEHTEHSRSVPVPKCYRGATEVSVAESGVTVGPRAYRA